MTCNISTCTSIAFVASPLPHRRSAAVYSHAAIADAARSPPFALNSGPTLAASSTETARSAPQVLTNVGCCIAAAAFAGQQRHGRRRRGRGRTARAAAGPLDYYGLLGIPKFTSERKVIMKGRNRVCKMIHPDILGDKAEAVMRLVTDAYQILKDPDQREAYDKILKAAGVQGSTRRSVTPKDADLPESAKGGDARMLFVDQSRCIGCMKCVDQAGSTFQADKGEASVRVGVQWADSEENIAIARENCPSASIGFVEPNDLPFLEDAMNQWLVTRRLGSFKGSELAGPYESFHQQQLMQLAVMDFESEDGALDVAFDIDEMTAGNEQLQEQTTEIQEAVMASNIPDNVKQQVWPEMEGSVAAGGDGDAFSGGPGARAQLVKALFMALDTDGDGYLKEDELKVFGELSGFEGDDNDWSEEYRLMCNFNIAEPTEGISEMLLYKLVNDDKDGGMFVSDLEIVCMLEELRDTWVFNEDYELLRRNPVKFREYDKIGSY